MAKLPRVDHAEELHEDECLEHNREGTKLVGRLVKSPFSSQWVIDYVILVWVQWVLVLIRLKVEDSISF